MKGLKIQYLSLPNLHHMQHTSDIFQELNQHTG